MSWLEIVFLVLGGASAVACETLFRVHQGSFSQIATLSIPLAMLTNYGVFVVMKTGKSLIEGLILWTVMTSIMRVISTFVILGERPASQQWVAFGLVLTASFVSKFWK